MNVRLLSILTVIVLALGAAAYFFGQERKALRSEAFAEGPLTPGIETRINDVDEARLESQEGGVLTLQRKAGGWTIAEHFGYPANHERVTGLLKHIATLRILEPKTEKPENHARLNLDDPAGENSLATRITLKVGAETVADLVVGLNRAPAHGGGAFVRRWGEDQTWLVEGEFKPKRRALDLLDRNVVNIDGRRIRLAHIERPAPDDAAADARSEVVLVGKAAPDQPKYSLGAEIPEEAAAKPDHELSSVARVPDFLIFEDVRPASEVDMTGAVTAIYETFDGLRLVLKAKQQADGEAWVTAELATVDRSPGLDAFIAEHQGKDSEAGRIADEFKTPDEVKAEAEKWAARTKGWAYRLTDYKTKRVMVKTADMVDLPEPKSEPQRDDAAAPAKAQ